MTENNNRIGMHHSFDADLAVELKSIDLAVLVHHFQFWIRHNAATGTNTYDGKTWTFQSLKDIAAHFPYWSNKQVERLINKLVELEILVKGNYNTSAYDRTVWYAFKNEERFTISRNREIEIPKPGNQNPEIGTPIPDTKKKKKKKSAPLIEFNYESNEFDNITDADKAEWLSIYSGVDVELELRKMRQWLMDPKNPERDGNRTFITNWLSRAQKEVKKTPKKPTANPAIQDADVIPFNADIAQSYRDESEEAYVAYLQRITDKKHYQEYLKSKGL
jgi:hypothetical protein